MSKRDRQGCIVLETIRQGRLETPGYEPSVVKFFQAIGREMQQHIHSFYCPEAPIRRGDEMPELANILPPYDECWIETVDASGWPAGYAISRMDADPEGPDGADAKHVVSIICFGMKPDSGYARSLAALRVVLKGNGRAIQSATPPIYTIKVRPEENGIINAEACAPAIVILQRMNYRNIGFFPVKDPAEANMSLPRKMRRAAFGRRYHVLVIRDMKDVRADRKVVDYQGLMPLHWARGHVARYGLEFGHGLLFGKYAGEFWIQPHAKGKPENGIIDKDYRLSPTGPRAAS